MTEEGKQDINMRQALTPETFPEIMPQRKAYICCKPFAICNIINKYWSQSTCQQFYRNHLNSKGC